MKILLINQSTYEQRVPHYGLGVLSAVLQKAGHEVLVLDYALSMSLPAVEEVLREFSPELVGICIYSSTKDLCDNTIDRIRRINPAIPIICGGPHASCYSVELAADDRIDAVVIGEAEPIIVDLVKRARRGHKLLPDRPPLPDVETVPWPDFRSFLGWEQIEIYPVVSSRGCPYGCTFCSVSVVNSKKWRPRSDSGCVEELAHAKAVLPRVEHFVLWDDMFNLKIERGKSLLREINRGKQQGRFDFTMQIGNLRADKIDDEFLELMKAAGCEVVQLGAEHGNPAVFKMINKGESLEDIRRACLLVKKHGLKLYLSFIIGLPGDSIRATLDSIRFARNVGSDVSYWNVMVPYKGTKAYSWFREHGRVGDTKTPHTLIHSYEALLPNADTADFPASQRLQALFIAEVMTNRASLRGMKCALMAAYSIRFGFFLDLLSLIREKMARKLRRALQSPLDPAGDAIPGEKEEDVERISC